MTRRVTVLVVLAVLALHKPGAARAQDTLAAAAVPHRLATDPSRAQPFSRSLEMVVHTVDSAIVIGERDLTMNYAAYAGVTGWLLVETRTGIVPSSESLFVTRDLRPLHWSAAVRGMQLSAEFAGDSIYGGVGLPTGKLNLVLASASDLVVSVPMLEAILPTLPLWRDWSDSVGVLSVDASGAAITRAELAVIGDEELVGADFGVRPHWVVALRDSANTVLFWVDEAQGSVSRILYSLPAHVGQTLELRQRAIAAPSFRW